tara:strand:+ start:819 stop:1676 length:858 start_codon:yes stop_codon:yes gene_type:complete
MATQIALDATGTKLNFDSNTFVIDESSNRVGIGTASPEANSKLHIVGTTNFGGADPAIIRLENTDATGEDWLIYQNSAGQFQIAEEDGTTRLLFNYNGDAYFGGGGNVGIGTTSPSYQLHVKKTSGSAEVQIEGYETDARLYLYNDESNWLIQNDYSNSGALSFFTGGTHRVVVTTSGNVGIGTSSPSYPFEVNNSSSGSDNCNMLLKSGASGQAGIYFGDTDSAGAGRIYYDHDTDDMTFKTDATDRMTIKSDGGIVMNNLPTSDPGVAGELWNSSGDVKISAG